MDIWKRNRVALGWTLGCLCLGVGQVGCGRSEPHPPLDSAAGHGHVHTAKYGGVLVEVGEHQFNLEVLVDPAVGKLTLWTLDAHAESYVRIATKSVELVAKVGEGSEQPLVVEAVANPATGEVAGNSAQFEGRADWLKGAKDVEGRIKSITLGTKTFTDLKFDWPHGTTSGHQH